MDEAYQAGKARQSNGHSRLAAFYAERGEEARVSQLLSYAHGNEHHRVSVCCLQVRPIVQLYIHIYSTFDFQEIVHCPPLSPRGHPAIDYFEHD